VPANSAMAVIDQLRQFGETRRGWLGVRIQQVTDDIAESLNITPPRGALVAGVDDKGPAKPAGIEPGDVVVSFDGRDIKEMHDLPRVVADAPVGKVVEVVVIRKGKQETHKVTVGRLQDTEKVAEASAKQEPPADKSVVQKTLGLELSALSDDAGRCHCPGAIRGRWQPHRHAEAARCAQGAGQEACRPAGVKRQRRHALCRFEFAIARMPIS
jgi:serine protease Do